MGVLVGGGGWGGGMKGSPGRFSRFRKGHLGGFRGSEGVTSQVLTQTKGSIGAFLGESKSTLQGLVRLGLIGVVGGDGVRGPCLRRGGVHTEHAEILKLREKCG
jgi:hypothetical protein